MLELHCVAPRPLYVVAEPSFIVDFARLLELVRVDALTDRLLPLLLLNLSFALAQFFHQMFALLIFEDGILALH